MRAAAAPFLSATSDPASCANALRIVVLEGERGRADLRVQAQIPRAVPYAQDALDAAIEAIRQVVDFARATELERLATRRALRATYASRRPALDELAHDHIRVPRSEVAEA